MMGRNAFAGDSEADRSERMREGRQVRRTTTSATVTVTAKKQMYSIE